MPDEAQPKPKSNGTQFVSRNVAKLHLDRLTVGDRVADRLAEVAGSWTFILGFALCLIIWIAVNRALPKPERFDPYPFILLNLVLSCLAAIQAPVIMMSQNRQEMRDRLRDEEDFAVNRKAEQEVSHIQEELDGIRAEDLKRLLDLQEQQVALLHQLLRTPNAGDQTPGAGEA